MPNNFSEIGFPSITVGIGLAQTITRYIEGDNRRALYSIVTNLEQNYTLVRGTHNIQFGGNFHNERNHLLPDQGGISGTALYNSLAPPRSKVRRSAAQPAPPSFHRPDMTGQLLSGYAARYDVGLKRGFMQVYQKKFGLYLQDNYRVNDRLTLNAGIALGHQSGLPRTQRSCSAFDVENHALLLPESLDYYYKIGATTPQLVNLYQAVGVKFESAADVGRVVTSFSIRTSIISALAPGSLTGCLTVPVNWSFAADTASTHRPFRSAHCCRSFRDLLPFRTTFSYNPNAAAQVRMAFRTICCGRRRPSSPASTAPMLSTSPIPRHRARAERGRHGGRSPSLRVHEWNLTVEKQISSNTVFRFTYNGKHD